MKISLTLFFFSIVLCFSAQSQNVLIIWDNSPTNINNASLKDGLIASGLNVTMSDVSETQWDNTNPSLAGFDAVVHINGTTFGTGMPLAGQNALVDFVQNNGGKYVGFEWNAYEVDASGSMATMADLTLFVRHNSQSPATRVLEVVPSESSDPIFDGVSLPYSIVGCMEIGGLRTFNSNPSRAIMTCAGKDAAAVRSFGNGEVLNFAFAPNWDSSSTALSEVNVQKMIANFIDPCPIGTSVDTQSECVSYTWMDGNTYTESNNTATYIISGGAANGCDSIVTLDLTIINPANEVDTQSACVSYTWIDGNTYTESNNTATYILAGGAANGCDSIITLDLTIIDDVEDPIASCQNISIQLDENGSGSIATSDINNGSTDNCGIASVASSQLLFDCSHVGTNLVILTVTDMAGNLSTCNSTVTVEDLIAPTANCSNVTIQLDSNGVGTITSSDVASASTDNCGVSNISLDQSSFDCSHVGQQIIVVAVTDDSGNSQNCNATITVEDQVAPMAVCVNTSISLDENGLATVAVEDIDGGSADNCGVSNVSLSHMEFDCSQVGLNTVTLSVTDNNDNQTSCDATVTVVDEVEPVAITQDISVYLDETGNATILHTDLNNGSTDNCEIVTFTASNVVYTVTHIGVNNETLTVMDAASNSDTAPAIVTVLDTVAPSAVCQDLVLQLDNSGNAVLTAELLDGGSSDAAGIASVSINSTDENWDCTDIGSHVVTLTVTDNSGNISSCQSDLTIENDVVISLTTNGNTLIADNADASYQWLDCDNNYAIIEGETSQSFTATVNGNYALQLTANGCEYITDCVSITTVDVVETSFKKEINVYPNPSHGAFNIDLGSMQEKVQVTIFDIYGKVVLEQNYDRSEVISLSLSNPTGVYFAHLQANEKQAILRLVKD